LSRATTSDDVERAVDDRVAHQVHHLGLGPAGGADRDAVQGDAVGHDHAGVAPVALGQGDALVQAQEAGHLGDVLHRHPDVVHAPAQVLGDAVEGVGDQLLEPLGGDVDHRGPG